MSTLVIASASFLLGCIATLAVSAAARRLPQFSRRTRRAARAAESALRVERRATIAEVLDRQATGADDLAMTFAAAAQHASTHRPAR